MQVTPASEYLTREERSALMKHKDGLAAWEILQHWAVIIGAFAMVHFFPNVLTVILALFLIGGKQLACAILMHDAGHYAVLGNKKWNDVVGQWLGAYPIFNNMKRYRDYHFQHHKHTGLEDDPDLLLTRGYPTSPSSMRRKFFRDLTGQTGIKALFGLMMMHVGLLEYSLGGKIIKPDPKPSQTQILKNAWTNLKGPLAANLVMLALLWALSSPWLYLLWIGAYLTTFQFSLRVRSIAEHSVLENPTDPYLNTRTTLANFWERHLFAPYHVNYHCEHHMLMAVPSYNLPEMHRILMERGFYERGVMAQNYWEVIRKAGSESQDRVKPA